MLPGQRPWRELHWLSLMPDTTVTAVGSPRPPEAVAHVHRPYRHPIKRFVEAGAFAWLQDLDSLPGPADWVASLELCSLVSGQASRLARRLGARQAVLVWANDPDTPLYKLPPYRQALERSREAEIFICLVEAARRHCLALGIPEERLRQVYPGVDTTLFHPGPRPEEPIIVFVSPLASNKGIDRVLAAFRLVRSRIPETRLRIYGGGPLEKLVTEAASDDPHITFHGRVDRQGVAEALRAGSVFTTAPRPTRVWNEQFGLAYTEAMASGLPVVTTACGSNHEAVPPPNLLVPDTAGDLADGLIHFLEDEGHSRHVGQENREYALNHHELNRQSRRLADALASVE
jgi:phosphatidyl-myo-inositol dimannoside synthase